MGRDLTQEILQNKSLSELKGVGPKTCERLARIGIESTQQLLFHLPLRYEDRTQLTPISQLKPNSYSLFEGVVKAAGIVPGRRRSFVIKLQQEYSAISLRLFHFSAAQTRGLTVGTRLRCFGEIRFGRSSLECFHPEYSVLNDDSTDPPLPQALTPVYPSTEGLHQASFRKVVGQVLPLLDSHSIDDLIPEQFIAELPNGKETLAMFAGFPLATTLRILHAPLKSEQALLSACQKRLAFEELLAHHLSLLKVRQRVRQLVAPRLKSDKVLHQRFLTELGFTLTAAQARVSKQLMQQLNQKTPMLRLVQGDVGCGKTVVAALAALQAIASGYQAVLMAPTEILTEQHFRAFSDWFDPLGITVGMLSGQQSAKQKRESLAAIASGEISFIVGTHAVIQDAVSYEQLGLIIIDEQHRFGVDQRLNLRKKALNSGVCPHQIIMTATPIPRTLAMAAYADLDVSVIDELPPGRTPVHTSVLDNGSRGRVVDRVYRACQQGRQAYWVCTLVEESEAIQSQAAESTAEELRTALPDLQVGLVHGRMKAAEKAEVMNCFKSGAIHLLVATTVIEVGVDVSNASLMIIENAERLGLSQIHQLRGRVGRGQAASHCLLLYQKPLSANGKRRLDTLRNSSDGFYIAEQDLEIRGPGEVLGTRQTGMLQFRIADLERDVELLELVQHTGESYMSGYPNKVQMLIDRWIGASEFYGNA
ncbi:MAG: ATP-dependent DNA helicase RecG [Pseudomonadota bacterium]